MKYFALVALIALMGQDTEVNAIRINTRMNIMGQIAKGDEKKEEKKEEKKDEKKE